MVGLEIVVVPSSSPCYLYGLPALSQGSSWATARPVALAVAHCCRHSTRGLLPVVHGRRSCRYYYNFDSVVAKGCCGGRHWSCCRGEKSEGHWQDRFALVSRATAAAAAAVMAVVLVVRQSPVGDLAAVPETI